MLKTREVTIMKQKNDDQAGIEIPFRHTAFPLQHTGPRSQTAGINLQHNGNLGSITVRALAEALNGTRKHVARYCYACFNYRVNLIEKLNSPFGPDSPVAQ